MTLLMGIIGLAAGDRKSKMWPRDSGFDPRQSQTFMMIRNYGEFTFQYTYKYLSLLMYQN